MKKRLQQLGFVITIICLSIIGTSTAQASTFKDVSYQYWAYKDIQFAAQHNVIRGFSDGYFRPGYDIKRKDAAVMLTRVLDLYELENEPTPVEDLLPTSPGYKEIMIALENNWLSLDKGYFHPDEPLTRDEMSKMLATAYGYEGKGGSQFIDVPYEDPYFLYIDAIAFEEVTTGYKDDTFRPSETVTRGQFSAFIYRVYQKPVAYEVRNDGELIDVVQNVDDAIELALYYPKGTVHPQSNKFNKYPQTIAAADKTNLNSGVLIYNGYNETEKFTTNFFNQYLKTKLKDGERKDMFDTFVILGLRYNENNDQFVDGPSNHANYSDWRTYVEKTFAQDGAVVNLNSTARQLNRKVDVYIAIPYPKRNEPIIKFNGESAGCDVYARYDLANWYVKEVMERFENGKYENLNFKGFYWLSETVRTVDDEVIISSISSILRKNNKFFIYSPHATSTNFYKWKDYGFDAAFLQPNAFRSSITNKEERLHRAFLNAQIYGTGITIEIDSYHTDKAEQGVETFDLYMDMSKRYGLDEKGMMFYQGVNMVERMATFDHPIYKRWYEQLTETFFNKQ
ncbi:DUF4855 domain-containing protein [Sporosarcina highlanderae]|uniref:DUF4855 domain-containing protein n=1 Tax=Sporosarcina highlanderae TaxID=3035916 RepID=A0ABT8JLC1_9BACL|nr:DUF4855 domain-containing protein [Sporosarcina highlanderae]MDN4605943.1 DUF4855 domain-containing protein [Sporosarcina highlanderae]